MLIFRLLPMRFVDLPDTFLARTVEANHILLVRRPTEHIRCFANAGVGRGSEAIHTLLQDLRNSVE